ncbi:MAG: hypothetical protein SFY81_13675 [Verrucomicrobiota bacterium]|nr:hypothetical protein [Verrucomicrobiota bacterium]
MDGFELVMSCEERFGISISDAEAERIHTPYDLVQAIESKLILSKNPACLNQRCFYVLRRALVKMNVAERKQVRPELPLRDLVTESEEATFWLGLQRAIDARFWPSLEVSAQIDKAIKLTLWFAFFAIFILIWNGFGRNLDSALSGCAIGVTLACLLNAYLRHECKPYQKFIPANLKTINDLLPYSATAKEISWTRSDISREVKQIVISVLGINEKQYREDANFVKDLGMG